MRPVSGTMLVVAALLTSPALAGAVMGSVPVDVALVRYLVAAGVSWVLLALAADTFWSPAAPAPVQAPATPSAEDEAEERPASS
ncbi:hypothetical protein [Nocardioides zeicaulis]|uniref:Peptidoglycan-binding protein n=1 Tax=Nocardioides zeicaulis TaxID=1776857 RepID=A0ABV6E216_9ACTN